MPRKKNEDKGSQNTLDNINLDNVALNDSTLEELTKESEEQSSPPKYYSPEWHDYVMSLFEESEKDDKGNPKVDGLRRVAELALGEICVSRPVHSVVTETVAHVNWELQIFWRPGVEVTFDLNSDLPIRVFGACASAYFEYTKSPYNQHLGSIADTKAEAKCLRRALRIRNCASEELEDTVEGGVTDGTFKDGDPITSTQKVQIEMMCKKMGISTEKLVTKSYLKPLDSISKGEASNLLVQLNSYQGGSNKQEIPDDIRI